MFPSCFGILACKWSRSTGSLGNAGLFLNEGMFAGSDGYVLKPERYCSSDGYVKSRMLDRIAISIFVGQCCSGARL